MWKKPSGNLDFWITQIALPSKLVKLCRIYCIYNSDTNQYKYLLWNWVLGKVSGILSRYSGWLPTEPSSETSPFCKLKSLGSSVEHPLVPTTFGFLNIWWELVSHNLCLKMKFKNQVTVLNALIIFCIQLWYYIIS